MIVHLDFETRSLISVKDVGAYAYARHPSTEVLCAAYAVDDEPTQICKSLVELAEHLLPLVADPAVTFYAHNAFFEQCIWQEILVKREFFPPIDIERWRCTAAKAAKMSLPRDLDSVGKALDLSLLKDDDGKKIMMKLSTPRKRRGKDEQVFWEYEDCPDDFERLYAYCIRDVDVERLVDKALPDLTQREQRIWFMDQRINFRGVQLDVPFIQQTLAFIEQTVEDLLSDFRATVNGEVDSPSQVKVFSTWLENQGYLLPNLQAATVDKVLKQDDLPPHVRKALTIRRQLSKISTSKYTAMLDRCDRADGKLRDILLYHAALTGRWGGRGVQPQNLPRGTVNSDTAVVHIMQGDYQWLQGLYSDLMAVYSSCIRGAFTASPGCELLVGDFSSIEAMGLPWLAGQLGTLDIFREGRDIYCEEATGIFGRPITKKDKYERSVGKVAVLALGYGGGIGAFGTMAKGYGVTLIPAYDVLWPTATEEEQRRAQGSYRFYMGRCKANGEPDPLDEKSALAADIIKQRWRRKNQAIVGFWAELEQAAINAVLTGQLCQVGGITYGMNGEFLLCRLPSGNCIVYPFAKVSQKETAWGELKYTLSYRTVDSQTYQFKREFTYGGKLTENVTQAICRDLLADALVRLEDNGFHVALHVHDEAVCDEPIGSKTLAEFEEVMAIVPEWATGIPVKVEVWKGQRYRK